MAQRVANPTSPVIDAHAEVPLSAKLRGPLRGTVVGLYGVASRNWNRAPGEIARGLREARHLHSRERRFVSDAVHQLVRLQRRLAFAGGLADGAAPPDALYLLWLAGCADDTFEPDAGVLAELQKLSIDLKPDLATRLSAIADPVRRLAVSYSAPDWLVSRFIDDLGEAGAVAFLHASNQRAPLFARVNRLKTDRGQLLLRLEKEGIASRPHPLTDDGLELLSSQNAYGLSAFQDGWFELQDLGSQLIGEVVAPPPRGRVLDLCAGAGGKTLHLAALLANGGRITACDVSGDKLDELRKRARRAGVTNMEAKRIPEDGPLEVAAGYDRVLVDAPCTGTGVLRRNPEARWRLTPSDLTELPALQLSILERAAPTVRPGGRLVYATCSILETENAQVLDRFVECNQNFERVSVKEILGKEKAYAIGDGEVLRTLPHTHGTDGFYAAVLRRRG